MSEACRKVDWPWQPKDRGRHVAGVLTRSQEDGTAEFLVAPVHSPIVDTNRYMGCGESDREHDLVKLIAFCVLLALPC